MTNDSTEKQAELQAFPHYPRHLWDAGDGGSNKRRLQDLAVVQMGHELFQETENYEFTLPESPVRYIVCYLYEGKSEIRINGDTYSLLPGDFVIYPPGGNIVERFPMGKACDWYWVMIEGPFVEQYMGSELSNSRISVGQIPILKTLFDNMLQVAFLSPFGPVIAAGIAVQILGYLAQSRTGLANINLAQGNFTVDAVASYLERHLADPLVLKDVAARFFISDSQFIRAFRAQVGIAPMRYLIWLRMERASSLLASGIPIAKVAQQVGYSEVSAFFRRFKREKGITPHQFRQQHTL